ncbi:MAG: helix-turn-helix transcriptional regulator [Clostridiales bacterium]|nr:helix-turn-helix transcriptional regulator [Clostridiales bacterium]
MNERLKEIRKYFKLSQKEFGQKIFLAQDHISSLEKGRRNLTDRTIKDICNTFNINEDWLRYGTGEMLVDLVDDLKNIDDETKDMVRKLMLLNNDDKKRMKKILDSFLE